jgi:hypothetical protein
MPASISTKAPNEVRFRTVPASVFLDLLHTERDLLVVRIDLEHDHLDLFRDRDDFRGVPDIACPRHLRDVNEPFDTFLQLDERAIVGDRDDLASNARTDRVLLVDIRPWIR